MSRAWAVLSWFGIAVVLAVVAIFALAERGALILAIPTVPIILLVGARFAWQASRNVDRARAIRREWRDGSADGRAVEAEASHDIRER